MRSVHRIPHWWRSAGRCCLHFNSICIWHSGRNCDDHCSGAGVSDHHYTEILLWIFMNKMSDCYRCSKRTQRSISGGQPDERKSRRSSAERSGRKKEQEKIRWLEEELGRRNLPFRRKIRKISEKQKKNPEDRRKKDRSCSEGQPEGEFNLPSFFCERRRNKTSQAETSGISDPSFAAADTTGRNRRAGF